MRQALASIVILALTITESGAFSARLPLRKPATTRWSGGDFDDFASFGDAAGADGEALAREFYQQLRDRKEEEKPTAPESPPMLSEQEARYVNREAFSRRQEVVAGKEVTPNIRKFTGQSDKDMPSAGLFSGRGASVFSIPTNTPRQRMAENEFSLVSGVERSLLIQIVVTLTLLSLAIYIGMTGGISSNDWSSLADSLDTSIEGIEGILPIPTDTETSVWL